MTIRKTVNLMIKSSNHNPYSGRLSKKDNVLCAIELAKLCKEFADTGQTDEAMDLDSEHWKLVIAKLKDIDLNIH